MISTVHSYPMAYLSIIYFSDRISLCCPGWTALARSELTCNLKFLGSGSPPVLAS
uniref:Uncharacterized protein n=1 Tax=Mandrillus leucophaeus TaxID=9568 RepID=A0A2K5XVX2_MANLE